MISGAAHGKVRLLKSPTGESMKLVGPGDAALVSGWKELPKAGDEVLQGTENEIKRALANRSRKADIEATIQDAEAINESRRAEREHREKEEEEGPSVSHSQEDQKKELRLVIKGDVSGTVEAVSGAVQGIGNHLAGVKVIATGVGEVSESDVMRAKAVDGEPSMKALGFSLLNGGRRHGCGFLGQHPASRPRDRGQPRGYNLGVENHICPDG